MYNIVPRDSTSTIEGKIKRIQERIAHACEESNRDVDSVQLIAVTKTYPLDVIREAFDAGIRHFGENRVQELKLKSQALPGVHKGGDVFWHMIGHIQRNKAKEVIDCADFVHALDTERLAVELDRRAGAADRKLPCLIQVNVSSEQSKFGLNPADVPDFLDKLVAFENLEIKGFMTLASPTPDPERVRPQFGLLRSILEEAKATHPGIGTFEYLSMGMSGDFEVAIQEGATHVRVGSALFGARS